MVFSLSQTSEFLKAIPDMHISFYKTQLFIHIHNRIHTQPTSLSDWTCQSSIKNQALTETSVIIDVETGLTPPVM